MTEAIEEYHQLVQRQGELLTGVANALKGAPPELTWWDHSDLPAVAISRMAALSQVREVMEDAYQQVLSGDPEAKVSLAAALKLCDEVLG